jgi:hypothetical protein
MIKFNRIYGIEQRILSGQWHHLLCWHRYAIREPAVRGATYHLQVVADVVSTGPAVVAFTAYDRWFHGYWLASSNEALTSDPTRAMRLANSCPSTTGGCIKGCRPW